jgi:hypothetical protein
VHVIGTVIFTVSAKWSGVPVLNIWALMKGITSRARGNSLLPVMVELQNTPAIRWRTPELGIHGSGEAAPHFFIDPELRGLAASIGIRIVRGEDGSGTGRRRPRNRRPWSSSGIYYFSVNATTMIEDYLCGAFFITRCLGLVLSDTT